MALAWTEWREINSQMMVMDAYQEVCACPLEFTDGTLQPSGRFGIHTSTVQDVEQLLCRIHAGQILSSNYSSHMTSA